MAGVGECNLQCHISISASPVYAVQSSVWITLLAVVNVVYWSVGLCPHVGQMSLVPKQSDLCSQALQGLAPTSAMTEISLEVAAWNAGLHLWATPWAIIPKSNCSGLLTTKFLSCILSGPSRSQLDSHSESSISPTERSSNLRRQKMIIIGKACCPGYTERNMCESCEIFLGQHLEWPWTEISCISYPNERT